MRFFLTFLIFTPFFIQSQTFTPGVSVLDSNGYVEYIPGNLPFVISAPHGGYLEPAGIPLRNCPGCVYARDSYTQEMTRSVLDEFIQTTGCYPHVIINLLHRNRFDANREINDAAVSNATVEISWRAYHRFIDSAKAKVIRDYNRGLFLDMHGHAHTIQRVELGYTLTRSELQMSDAQLNTQPLIDDSSIKKLVSDNILSLTHAELLRGEYSFGTLLENKGTPAVPSMQDPSPMGTDPYFSGGYNTIRHGSESGGNIDGIQLECHSDIRWDSLARESFADSLTRSINQFIDLHYNNQFMESFCSLNSSIQQHESQINVIVHPNPATEIVRVDYRNLALTEANQPNLRIVDLIGHEIYSIAIPKNSTYQKVNVSELPQGVYVISVIEGERKVTSEILIKQ